MTIRGIERVWRGKERDRERKMKVEGYLWGGRGGGGGDHSDLCLSSRFCDKSAFMGATSRHKPLLAYVHTT